MKNETLYNKTVNILVDAYFNDTLEHGNCYACAVGNLIAGNCGLSFLKPTTLSSIPFGVYTGLGLLYWDSNNLFEHNPINAMHRGKVDQEPTNKQIELVETTGYSIEELARIEWAFERIGFGVGRKTNDEMFDGLMSVIETLDEIHEINDQSVSESSKKKFVRAEQRTER